MKNTIKSVAFLLAVIICFCTLASCAEDTPKDTTAVSTDLSTEAPTPDTTTQSSESDVTTTPTSDETTGEEAPDDIPVNETYVIKVEDGVINYCITRPRNLSATSPVLAKQQYISTILKDLIGTSAPLDTDWARNEDSEKLEIIVGATDHPETQMILDKCAYGEYHVQAVGNKIILLGYTEEAITAAANHLTTLFKRHRNTADKSITLKSEDIYAHGSVNDQLAALPAYTDGEFLTYYDAGLADIDRQCDEIIIKDTSLEKFNEYLDYMAKKGYSVYNTNEVNNSKFVTLNSEAYTVNAGYYNYEKSVRIMIEPLSPAYSISGDYKKVTTSLITLIGVEPKRGELNRCNGLSMIMRLEDGRFLVVDGGEDSKSLGGSTDSSSNPNCYDNVDYFIEVIKGQSKDYTSTPTVAAWFLTHDHGDHSHMLTMDYGRIKAAGIKVEGIYATGLSKWEIKNSEIQNSYYEDIMKTVAPAFGATMNRMHAGQVMTFANCRVDILYTIESWADGNSKITVGLGNYNHSSVIFKTTFTDSASGKSTSVLNTGDGSAVGIRTAMQTFGDAMLKCDIAVASHHGGGSGDDTIMKSVFETIAAPVVLYPRGATDTSLSTFTSRKPSNVSIINLAKEVFYAGRSGQSTVIPVPYVYGNIISQTKLK